MTCTNHQRVDAQTQELPFSGQYTPTASQWPFPTAGQPPMDPPIHWPSSSPPAVPLPGMLAPPSALIGGLAG